MMSRKEVLKCPLLAESVFSSPMRVVISVSVELRSSESFSRKAIFVCWDSRQGVRPARGGVELDDYVDGTGH